MYYTFDLFKFNERGDLRSERSGAVSALIESAKNQPVEKILRLWKKQVEGLIVEIMLEGVPYPCLELPEYLSLKIDFLKRRFGKLGVNTFTDFQQRFDALL